MTTLKAQLIQVSAVLGLWLSLASTIAHASEELQSRVEINASPNVVWQVLTDFNNYPNWSQFIQQIAAENKGDKATGQGEYLQITVKLPNEKPMDFSPRVLVFDESKELRWKGNIAGMDFLFSGEHYFKLEKTANNKTLLIHGELFDGLLLPLLKDRLFENTPAGFEQFNLAIKKQSESI